MSQAMLQLNETRAALSAAMHNKDWEAIGDLDRQCREQVDVAMQDAERDEQALRETMEQLLALYAELVQVCTAQRTAIGAELTAVHRSSKGAKVYQMFG
ncbi:flagellar protein FliT [Pseudomonas sp. GD04087]|uniref:flagellar protein FliT n=1 Tax=Pseudomonas TaxID=286 RepID=UPI001F28B535|nr:MULTISPECIES: flagellar protein FliT [Pseudomonas]MCP1651237.1 16S rRNA C1402 (ribose-2'-O) methylase RsmI [Pseudomonas nitroreducens]MCP1684238.1 16S rRNA C1402 (ribose-2'-O) methylase RsmI [Pseudomonas nitroreducens]MDH0292535.1 flagellar protein FliT [Pseudomonas sp. GD04087]MDH1051172.1 flagellar protein FliT [Pseudomonas sp. GD03903]MDH1998444.1 flagellar protein FliT [Pseudomonas sp. GD03691]